MKRMAFFAMALVIAMTVIVAPRAAFGREREDTIRIEYTVEQQGHVRLSVFDAEEKLVVILVEDYLYPGNYTTIWNTADLAGGMYSGVLTCGDAVTDWTLIAVRK